MFYKEVTSGACCIGPIPDGPGKSPRGLCRVPELPEFANKFAAYRDDCISANDVELIDDCIRFDDEIEFCKSVALSVILRPKQ